MIDEKIPADKRDEIALLADVDHFMWIIGRRISSYYKIGPDTRRVLQAKVSQSTLTKKTEDKSWQTKFVYY